MAIENTDKAVHAIDHFMDLMENFGPDRFELDPSSPPKSYKIRLFYDTRTRKVTTRGELGYTFALTDITHQTWVRNSVSIESLVASISRCLKMRAKRIMADLSTNYDDWDGQNLKRLSRGRVTRGDLLPADINPNDLIEDLVDDVILGRISVTLPNSELLTMLSVEEETFVKELEQRVYDFLEEGSFHVVYLNPSLLGSFKDTEYVVRLVLELLEDLVYDRMFGEASLIFERTDFYPLLQKVKDIENIREQAEGLLKRLADEHGDADDMQCAPEFFEALGFEHVAVEVADPRHKAQRAYMSVQLLDAEEIELLTKDREVAYISKLDRMHTGVTGQLTISDINKMVDTTCYGVIDPLPGFSPGRVVQLSPRNLSSR